MRTGLREALGALAAVSLLAACTGANPEVETADTLIWALAGGDDPAHQATVEAWNAAHPEMPVQVEELPEEADGQRQQMSLELDAGGGQFDVLALDVMWMGEFAEYGWLESLEDVRGQVEPAVLPAALETAQYDGTLWGVPYNTNVAFLYYRTDLVEQPPTTWGELVEVGTAVAEREGIAAFAGQGAAYEGLTVTFLELLWGAGGDLYNDDWTAVRFGEDDAAERALQFMADAQDSGFFSPGFNTSYEEEARIEFQQGDAVFMRNWPYAHNLLSGEVAEEQSAVVDRFDVAPLPTFDGEGTVSALGGYNNAVSAFSEKKDVAREFVLFAGLDPAVQRSQAEEGLVPVLTATYAEFTDDPVLRLVQEVVEHAEPRPPVPEYSEISVGMQRAVFEAYNGEAEVGDAVDEIRELLREDLASRVELEENAADS